MSDDVKKLIENARGGRVKTFSQRVPAMRSVGGPLESVSGSVDVPTMRAVPFDGGKPVQRAAPGKNSAAASRDSKK